MKRVTIGLQMDSSFIRLLQANVALSRLGERDELDVLQQLGLAVLLEARGAEEAQVHAAILPMWRPHLDVLHDMRKTEEI